MKTITTRHLLLTLAAAAATAGVTGCDSQDAPTAAAAPAAHAQAVYVEDHTGPKWPVKEATAQWRRTVKGLDLRYGKCPAKSTCIRVRECTEAEAVASMDGDSMAVGRTTPKDGYADVCLGTGPDDTYLGDLGMTITCHELGHGLGLEHNADADSCMTEYAEDGAPHPGKRDIAALSP